jgi:hypothetical protein
MAFRPFGASAMLSMRPKLSLNQPVSTAPSGKYYFVISELPDLYRYHRQVQTSRLLTTPTPPHRRSAHPRRCSPPTVRSTARG